MSSSDESVTGVQSEQAGPAHRYGADLAAGIERRWQTEWADRGTFHAPNPVGDLAAREGGVPQDKMFVQDMFPYPSGAGLHVGHPLGYIATDVFARFHRMLGANVLHTLGYDAFGLPAEQYAVQTGQHPRVTTEANIANMERQLGRLGLGHDPRRVVASTDTEFYRWTQWIFLQIHGAWYDPDAPARGSGESSDDEVRTGRARPIAELREQFSGGARALPAEFTGRDWADLTAAEQEQILDSYRLVYLSDSEVNWCPGLGTVLANEEVTAEGLSERGNYPVFRKNLSQWMMRITSYADRLIDDLDRLDWPDKVKAMQRNWIGRSHGASVSFAVAENSIEVFTTRPDTLFGATYMVLSPEHPLVDELAGPFWPETADGGEVDERWTGGRSSPVEAVAEYRRVAATKTDLERQENKDKTGVFTGAYAVNPVNGASIPVFVADYVLMDYGTGAIMAVPAHDARDHEFAATFGLPIVQVVAPSEGAAGGSAGGDGLDVQAKAYAGDGVAVNSTNDRGLSLDGLGVDEAKDATIAWLEGEGTGEGTVQYKLRDWLFARQRYWGEPFPMVYDSDGVPHALPDEMLPVELPEVEDYQPVSFDPDDADSVPSPPLAKATEWLNVELDLNDGLGRRSFTRDANVMPNWAGSSWYQLRYIDPTNSDALCSIENERYWMGPQPETHGADDPGGVDLYVGGVEHAVLHLLYSRFWHKVLFDLGHVTSEEPYRRLFNQGYIQAFAYTDTRGVYVPAADVEERDGKFFLGDSPEAPEVFQEYGKMGKSLKNAVSPDEICETYGADTLRVYEMSMGPLDTSRPWATKDVVGAHRFLQRLWRVAVDESTGEIRVTDDEPSEDVLKALHKAIAGVRDDYAGLRDNTAIAKLIEYVNTLTKAYPTAGPGAPRSAVEPLILMVAPVAPHLAEELWSRLGHTGSLAHGPFPEHDEAYLVEDSVEYPVQIKGKVRSRITVPADAGPTDVEAAALADEKVQENLGGSEPKKVIVVPGKMINIVP